MPGFGAVEFLIGNVGCDAGTFTPNGKFETPDLMTGEVDFAPGWRTAVQAGDIQATRPRAKEIGVLPAKDGDQNASGNLGRSKSNSTVTKQRNGRHARPATIFARKRCERRVPASS
jgi:hypothetical protein